MRPLPVEFLLTARTDGWAAERMYLAWRADGIEHFGRLLDDTVAAIGANPEAFPRRYRRFRRALLPHSYYAAFFVIEPECATVVAVLDLRQRPARIRRALRARA